MPYKSLRDFIERAPLYSRLDTGLPTVEQATVVPVVDYYCAVCKTMRPFRIPGTSRVSAGQKGPGIGSSGGGPAPVAAPIKGGVRELHYVCTSCETATLTLWLEFAMRAVPQPDRPFPGGSLPTPARLELQWIRKVGQLPPWSPPNAHKQFAKLLREEDRTLFSKALACESQSYGIGAYAYYRRIVEDTIDGLLTSLSSVIPAEERDAYADAMAQVERTTVAADKIALVKDMLPSSLRPSGLNPLSVLHTALSQGLHGESDEKCLERAGDIRTVLQFLMTELAAHKDATAQFTDGMRRLLEKRTEKGDATATVNAETTE